MWHISYYLYYDYAVILTRLPVQLHIYATNYMAKYVYPNTVVKTKTFLYLPGMDFININ